MGMTVEVKRQLALLDPATGELIPISYDPISADEAASRLPATQAMVKELRRYEQFLADCVTDEMKARGQTERRAGDVMFELKGVADWVMDDPGAMFALLHESVARGDITEDEFNEAVAQVITYRANHARLNVLSKRVPAINEHRRRVEGDARLRVKSK